MFSAQTFTKHTCQNVEANNYAMLPLMFITSVANNYDVSVSVTDVKANNTAGIIKTLNMQKTDDRITESKV
jgi:hypothetical protein